MLWNLLERHARDAAASLAFVGDGQRLTWEELRDRAVASACALRRHGVAPGDAVGLILPNGPGFVCVFLALCRLGAIAVPMNTDLHAQEIESHLNRSGCRVAVVDSSLSDTAAHLQATGCLDHLLLEGARSGDFPHLTSFAGSDGDLQSLALPDAGGPLTRLLTSGTTGRPKCVQRTHGQVHFLAESYRNTVGLTRRDRILAAVPLCHGHGFCSGFLASLASGGTLYAEPRFQRRPILEQLESEEITVFSAVPFLFALLAETRMSRPLDLSRVRLCVSGAGALRRETWFRLRDSFGLEIRQSYGSVETGALTINLASDIESTCESVGTPLQGVDIAIRQEGLAPEELGTVGHVYARSPATGKVLEAEPDTVRDPSGWRPTHDLGRLDSAGRLYIVGRRNGIVNVAGRKVSTDEVEAVLRSHAAVKVVQVVPCLDSFGEEAVRAIIVLRSPCSRGELMDLCRRSLAEFKVPRVVDFVDSIPS